jgi:hypothetical protein
MISAREMMDTMAVIMKKYLIRSSLILRLTATAFSGKAPPSGEGGAKSG